MRSAEIDRHARRFTDVATAFQELVEMLDAEQWRAPSIEDGRPIGTIAHHVALGHAIGHWRVLAAASGYPQPIQQGSAAERNAAHASGTTPDRDATLQLLRTGMAALEAAIRSLRSDQLGTAIMIGPVTTTIGALVDETSRHVLEHDATIRRSIGPEGRAIITAKGS